MVSRISICTVQKINSNTYYYQYIYIRIVKTCFLCQTANTHLLRSVIFSSHLLQLFKQKTIGTTLQSLKKKMNWFRIRTNTLVISKHQVVYNYNNKTFKSSFFLKVVRKATNTSRETMEMLDGVKALWLQKAKKSIHPPCSPRRPRRCTCFTSSSSTQSKNVIEHIT